MPKVCVYGDLFDADHMMICMREGYIIQPHNEIRDLEAEILQALCTDVEREPVLQKVTEKCFQGAPTRPLTRDWISVRGASGRESSLRSLMLGYATLTQTHTRISLRSRFTSYMIDTSTVLEVELGTFTPLVFTSTGGMSDECQRYHSRLAELLALKKQESYASTIA